MSGTTTRVLFFVFFVDFFVWIDLFGGPAAFWWAAYTVPSAATTSSAVIAAQAKEQRASFNISFLLQN
jgi:hypothetical protein